MGNSKDIFKNISNKIHINMRKIYGKNGQNGQNNNNYGTNYTVKQYNVGSWFDNKQKVDISIIVPCYKSASVLSNQINNWKFCYDDGLSKEIIYVDDACPMNSKVSIIRSWNSNKNKLKKPVGKIITISNNSGFGNACNFGSKFASGDYLVFLNADTVVTDNWIKPMYDIFKNYQDVGIVGNLIYTDKNKIDSLGSEWSDTNEDFVHIGKHIHNGKKLETAYFLDGLPEDLKQIRQVLMTTGCCFMMPKKLFVNMKGFDPIYKIGYFEDSDLCMRTIAKGYNIFVTPDSKIYHKLSHSRSDSGEHMQKNRDTFRKKWVATKLVNGYLNNLKNNVNGNDVKIDKKKCVIYTAITNKNFAYDSIKEIPKHLHDINRIAFLDYEISNKSWITQKIHTEFHDPCRNAKIHKILSHKYFPNCEYSLWVDGSIKIKFEFDFEKLIQIYLRNHDMAVFKHSERKCIYTEAKVCCERKLDNVEIIKKQIDLYKSEGYPENNNLSECSVILRRHTPKIIEFNEAWWEEIKKYSRRDQLSFDYVRKKFDISVNYFAGTMRSENFLFHRDNHTGK